jgi:hypothetical protein
MELQQQASITHIRGCRRDSNQFTLGKVKPDNTTHAGPPRPHMRPHFATTIKESNLVPPFPSAHLPHDTSSGYPWVACTQSRYTSLQER